MRAWFRFYGPLEDFLGEWCRGGCLEFTAPVAPSVKDALESLGPPHVEVAHVVVDGRAVTFAHVLSDGERISVFPDGALLEGLPRVAPPPLRPLRFLLDGHLRRLARHLRLLGFDAAWGADPDDAELARRAAGEDRVLLSRDLALLKRRVILHGRFVRATDPAEQLREIVRAFDLAPDARPFSRCLLCSGLVEDVPKASVAAELPERTRRTYAHFRRCRDCGRVYWAGSHHEQLAAVVRSVLPGWHEPPPGTPRLE